MTRHSFRARFPLLFNQLAKAGQDEFTTAVECLLLRKMHPLRPTDLQKASFGPIIESTLPSMLGKPRGRYGGRARMVLIDDPDWSMLDLGFRPRTIG